MRNEFIYSSSINKYLNVLKKQLSGDIYAQNIVKSYFKEKIMSFRPKVYITRQIPQKGLERLLKKCNVSYWESPDPPLRTEILTNVRGVNVLCCMPTDSIDDEVLNAAGMCIFFFLAT